MHCSISCSRPLSNIGQRKTAFQPIEPPCESKAPKFYLEPTSPPDPRLVKQEHLILSLCISVHDIRGKHRTGSFCPSSRWFQKMSSDTEPSPYFPPELERLIFESAFEKSGLRGSTKYLLVARRVNV